MKHRHDKASKPFAERLEHLLEHLNHVLPNQAPIRDFVHHNTLHGFQHLPFPDAVRTASELTGNRGYWPLEKFREQYQQGRITQADLDTVLQQADVAADQVIITLKDKTLTRADIYRVVLSYPIQAITPHQLVWKIEEEQALACCQADVPHETKAQWLKRAIQQGLANESVAIQHLWQSCLEVLHFDRALSHAEELVHVAPDRASRLFGQTLAAGEMSLNPVLHQYAREVLDDLLHQVGHKMTLRGLLQVLLGHDILESARPLLLRPLSLWLDQGLAPNSATLPTKSFYTWWKMQAATDWSANLNGVPDWIEHLDSLPDEASATIEAELRRLGIPEANWETYLEHLALDLPGWSGMMLWRHRTPAYQHLPNAVDMRDYLAVRLLLEHITARQVCRDQWLIEASLPELRGYFLHHPDEFLVRYERFKGELPEYLMVFAHQLLDRQQIDLHQRDRYDAAAWLHLAQMIWAWKHSSVTDEGVNIQVSDRAWRLFRLAQHLGLTGVDIQQLGSEKVAELLASLEAMDEQQLSFLWLQAYELNYRNVIYNAILHNHQKGTWANRSCRPQAQVICCMDDREEGFRRHVEECDPSIETLGAAAFFNIPMNWQAMDDEYSSKLCPVPVTPVNLIQEKALAESATAFALHQKRRHERLGLFNGLHQWTRTRLGLGTLTALAAAPAALGVMAGKSFAPLRFGSSVQWAKKRFEGVVPSRLHLTASHIDPQRSAQDNQVGFTNEEQAQLVSNFLKATGLTQGFAPLVIMLGHYSTNQNNPHQAAYGCGACSGRYSGPNARSFAAMANRPEVRELLTAEDIQIPKDTWFIGGEHDTCTEEIRWQDLDLIPKRLELVFNDLQKTLYLASQHSAHERCRKLMSAPKNPSILAAAQHVAGRGMDYSQPRPELGHVTNAVAFVGRRHMSQSLFLDRRAFLISYDCHGDSDGRLLESVLLTTAPVGAGINLEYYFSTVDNDRYGCGSKVTHNVMGLLGVMEGTSSDLRTGLPKQMIEIHEPMRLQVVIEADLAIVEAVYQRQAVLQELIGNGWVLLGVKPPAVPEIYHFYPKQGFVRWTGSSELAQFEHSVDWYQGKKVHLPPVRIVSGATHV